MAYISSETIAKMRKELKVLFPTKAGWKLSVTKEHYSTVNVSIMEAPIKFDNTKHRSLSTRWEEQKELIEVIEKINKVISSGSYNRNANDPGADYCDYNYYSDIFMGKWNKPYVN